jgi:hypothetical protein
VGESLLLREGGWVHRCGGLLNPGRLIVEDGIDERLLMSMELALIGAAPGGRGGDTSRG